MCAYSYEVVFVAQVARLALREPVQVHRQGFGSRTRVSRSGVATEAECTDCDDDCR